MGLDVYVGPLSRYYAGDWETVIQQAAKEDGIPVRIVRPEQPRQSLLGRLRDLVRPRGPAAAQRAVRRWRDRLRKELGISDLDWNEFPDAEYATDKPAWDCYGGLVLWAAYEELPNAKRRETAKGWDEDSAYLTSRVNPRSRYRHICWLIPRSGCQLNLAYPCEPLPLQATTSWWDQACDCWLNFVSSTRALGKRRISKFISGVSMAPITARRWRRARG